MGKSNTNNKSNKTGSYTDFYYHFFRNTLVVSLPLLVISALILGFAIPHSSARVSSSDSLAISVPSSCTLSSSVDEAHSASIINGTYRSDIGTTALSTFCNDKNGYSVYAIGDSLNSEGNNTLVGSNGSNISSGTATSGDTSNWAMKLALKEGDTSTSTSTTPPTIISPFNSYSTVPTTWTKVATIPSSTTDMKEGSNFTTTYATYISPTQAAGTYLGQVKYLLTHPSAAEPDTSYFIMQEVANWKNDLDEEESVQAIDIRDGRQYWVTRLADGHIWMTQNLDLDLDPAKPLTSNNTDLTDHSLTGAYADDYNYDPNTGITTWTPERKTIDFQNTTVTGWTNDNSNPYSANKTDSTETGHASLGNYYNWTAAIASNNSSSLTQDTLNNIANNPKNSICPKGWRLPTISSQSETGSGSTNEFARLNYLYNGNKTDTDAGLISQPVYFRKAGNIWSTSYANLNTVSHNWSSTYYNSTKAYEFYFLSSEVGKQNLDRVLGFSVRCVAR
ncbi:hypothetical protein IJJ53_03805 [Candidatus Saccharibacteria bacterium]|nr:hypothetical protein [Candidatus Saccharibacteria bacterium]